MGKHKAHSRAAAGIIRKPWIFAGAAFALDIVMLVMGIILSGLDFSGDIVYTVTESEVKQSDPLWFFGVAAAAALGICCVMVGLIIGGAFSFKGRIRAEWIAGSVGLLVASLAMIGCSAYMTLGFPAKSAKLYSYSDETYQIIIEESEPYFGKASVAFYIANAGDSDSKGAMLLAKTDLNELSDSDERYSIDWISEEDLIIGFQDGESSYRTLQMKVDKQALESEEYQVTEES